MSHEFTPAADPTTIEVESGKRVSIDLGRGLTLDVMVVLPGEVIAFLVLEGAPLGEIKGGEA